MMKTVILLAVVGHILCGVCDCLLSYTRQGKHLRRIDLGCIKDPQRMAEEFRDMPLSWPLISMILGTFSILAFGFAYFALAQWMRQFSVAAADIMFVSAAVFLIPIVTHHVFCGAVEWLYIRMGRTDEARAAVLDMQKKTICTMFAGYAGLLVFLVTLLFMVVSGRTSLPAWGCIFNTLVFMLAMLPTKLPAKGNIAGALMYIGLLFLI